MRIRFDLLLPLPAEQLFPALPPLHITSVPLAPEPEQQSSSAIINGVPLGILVFERCGNTSFEAHSILYTPPFLPINRWGRGMRMHPQNQLNTIEQRKNIGVSL